MKKFKLTDLLIFVVTAELVGALSALLAGDFTSFYAEVIRPPLSPPAWLFPVVWAILYALMGISAYMIWNNRKNELRRSSALKLYYIQLAVNFSWSIIFFRFRASTARRSSLTSAITPSQTCRADISVASLAGSDTAETS